MTMDKLKMHSPDLSQENIAKIRDLFPGCVTEALDGAGLCAVDVPVLAQKPMDQQLREKMIAEFEKIKAGF